MSTDPTKPPADLDELVAHCVTALETDGPDAVARICAEHEEHAEQILARLAALGQQGLLDQQLERPEPEQIGPYRILDVLGEGAMGKVYRAEQREPVRRRVALKVLKVAIDDDVLKRFELERRALAAMNHSSIAKIFDAGTTAAGQPYFVMELVEGLPLTTYCDKHRLDLEQRVAVFQKICQGVHHAHQKGVMHRDLKPANVLVIREGDTAQPKILDFGLAKATDRELFAQTIYTERALIVGTPEYMAPEQAALDGEVIDARADIYSLGVMLYELLAGALPFSSVELRRAGWGEIRRKLQEDEPPKPSAKVRSLAIRDDEDPHRRSTLRARARDLSGDLDWIVFKAMAKEPERRYESAAALAKDLQRYAEHEPVDAGPPSASYRIKKFARRYRPQVVAAVLVLLTLIGGTVGTWIGFAEARASARLAEQRAVEATRIAEFQSERLGDIQVERMGHRIRLDVFEQARAAMSRNGLDANQIAERIAQLEALLAGANFTSLALDTLDVSIFDSTLKAIQSQFDDQPIVRARLLQTAASTMMDLGLIDRAVAPQQRALAIRATRGDDHVDTLESMNEMARLLSKRGELDAAESTYLQALHTSRTALGDENRVTVALIINLQNLASVFHSLGDLAEAERLLRESLDGCRRELGDDHYRTLNAVSNLGMLSIDRGDLAEAERHCRDSVAGRRRVLGDEHPDTLVSIHNLGTLLDRRDDPIGAEACFREAVETRGRVLGAGHRSTIQSILSLAKILVAQGKPAEAEPYLREAVERGRRSLDDDDPEALTVVDDLGHLLYSRGMLKEAEPYVRRALERRRQVSGPDHPDTLESLQNLGALLHALGQPEAAEPYVREAFEGQRRIRGGEHPDTLLAKMTLGMLLQAQGRSAEAEGLLREALAGMQRELSDDHRHTLVAINNVGFSLQTQGRLAEAEPFVREALERQRRVLGDDHPDTLSSLNSLGTLLQAQRKYDEAEQCLRQSLEAMRRTQGDAHPKTLTSFNNLGVLLGIQGKLSEAEALCRIALDGRRRALGDSHDSTRQSMHNVGYQQMRISKQEVADAAFADAEPRILEAIDLFTEHYGDGHRWVRTCVEHIVALYEAWHLAEPEAGHAAQAAVWRAR